VGRGSDRASEPSCSPLAFACVAQVYLHMSVVAPSHPISKEKNLTPVSEVRLSHFFLGPVVYAEKWEATNAEKEEIYLQAVPGTSANACIVM